ncbi:uncharacterized protein METZ01_LOCUS193704 [marine metagenome]|uniref:Uncharacterized protein n=1 Tax=marine metagenome TaxID=408172 RepID=A0A382DQW7_9ZZZZ
MKGGSQKIRSNFDSEIFFFSINSKISLKNIFISFFTFNFLIFFSNTSIAPFFFSTKQTLLACLDKHSNPNDPVPAYKSKIFDCSNCNEILFE